MRITWTLPSGASDTGVVECWASKAEIGEIDDNADVSNSPESLARRVSEQFASGKHFGRHKTSKIDRHYVN